MAILQSDGVNHTSDLILRRNGTEGLRLTSSTVQVSSINDGPLAGNRNAIINGGMQIAQRGTSITATAGQLTYTLDRWIVGANTASVTATQGSQTSFPYNFLSVTGAAGNTGMSIRQRIEANNIRHLAEQQVTLSFHIYNATSNATSIQVQMDRANAVDNFSSATQFFTTTLGSLSDTSKRSITVTLPAEARNGVEVRFVTNALTSGILVLHTVQLEPGPVATPFESRPIGAERDLCERYYQVVDLFMAGISANGATNGYRTKLSTVMRVTPTISVVNITNVGTTGATVEVVGNGHVSHVSVGSGSGTFGYISGAVGILTAEL